MTTATRQRSETSEQILDLAETLIQTRGYSAFSYQDIADALGIRKASIHYHFPSKTDLGVAVIERYIARFDAALVEIANDQAQSSMAMLDFYVQPYLKFAETPDRVCLSAALAGEMLALGPESAEMHREAGREIARLGIDVLWGVRGLAKGIVAGAQEERLAATRFFESSDDAATAALDEVRAGDLILVKGSRSVETDKIVAALKQRFPVAGGDKR